MGQNASTYSKLNKAHKHGSVADVANILNQPNINFNYLLRMACHQNDEGLIRLVMNRASNILEEFLRACRNKKYNIVEILIPACNADDLNFGLIVAARNNDLDLINILINNNANNINIGLIYAFNYRSYNAAKLLIEKGAKLP